jgi:hypothetical protein
MVLACETGFVGAVAERFIAAEQQHEHSCATERYCCAMKKVAEVLEGLREEERRLSVELSGVHRAIAALEEVMGIAPAQAPEQTGAIAQEHGEPPPPDPGASGPMDQPGPYATGGFYDSAAAYLRAAGEPRTAQEIAEALQAGGYPTRATNFRATVRTMLNRRLSAEAHGIYASETGGRWFVRT